VPLKWKNYDILDNQRLLLKNVLGTPTMTAMESGVTPQILTLDGSIATSQNAVNLCYFVFQTNFNEIAGS